jgi:hypothetical protein
MDSVLVVELVKEKAHEVLELICLQLADILLFFEVLQLLNGDREPKLNECLDSF